MDNIGFHPIPAIQRMATVKWNPDDTITEVDLVRQAKLGAVSGIDIEQTPNGYQVLVRLKWHPSQVILRTRRAGDEARIFKSLERLVAFIQLRLPSVKQVELHLAQTKTKKR